MQILLQTSSPPSRCFHLGDKDSFFKTRFSGIKWDGSHLQCQAAKWELVNPPT